MTVVIIDESLPDSDVEYEGRSEIRSTGIVTVNKRKTGTILYAVDQLDNLLSISELNTVTIEPSTETPVYLVETRNVDTQFASTSEGLLTVQYEDPSHYWSFPDDADDYEEINFANVAKPVYILQEGSLPEDFVEVRLRGAGKSFSSGEGTNFLSQNEDREMLSRGMPLYIHLHDPSQVSTVPENMKTVSAADGYPTGEPDPSGTIVIISDGGSISVNGGDYIVEGTVDVNGEEDADESPTLHIVDAWTSIGSSSATQSLSVTSQNGAIVRTVESEGGASKLYVRLEEDDSYAWISDNEGNVAVKLAGGGTLEEKTAIRIVLVGTDESGNLLYERVRFLAEGQGAALRQQRDTLTSKRLDGQEVPFSDRMVSTLELSEDAEGDLLIGENSIYLSSSAEPVRQAQSITGLSAVEIVSDGTLQLSYSAATALSYVNLSSNISITASGRLSVVEEGQENASFTVIAAESVAYEAAQLTVTVTIVPAKASQTITGPETFVMTVTEEQRSVDLSYTAPTALRFADLSPQGAELIEVSTEAGAQTQRLSVPAGVEGPVTFKVHADETDSYSSAPPLLVTVTVRELDGSRIQTIAGPTSISMIVLNGETSAPITLSSTYSAQTTITFQDLLPANAIEVGEDGTLKAVDGSSAGAATFRVVAEESDLFDAAEVTVTVSIARATIPPYLKLGDTFTVSNGLSTTLALGENSDLYDLSATTVDAGETVNIEIIQQPQ